MDRSAGRQDLTVCRRHKQVRLEGSDAFQAVRSIHVLGLLDRDRDRFGRPLDAAGYQLLLSSLRAIGLGHQRHHGVPGLDQVLERGQCKVAGAEHDDPGRSGHEVNRLADEGQVIQGQMPTPSISQPFESSEAVSGTGRSILSSRRTRSASAGIEPSCWAWRYFNSNSRSFSPSECLASGSR